jgi:hypothetical protein
LINPDHILSVPIGSTRENKKTDHRVPSFIVVLMFTKISYIDEHSFVSVHVSVDNVCKNGFREQHEWKGEIGR